MPNGIFDATIYLPSGVHAGELKSSVGVLRDLLHAGAVWMNDPDIFAAFAIGDERHPLPVGRKSRLAVKGHTAGNQFGLPAINRQRVKIAHQLKHNGLAIRRNIQRKPRALIGRERNFVIRTSAAGLSSRLSCPCRLSCRPFFSSFLSLSCSSTEEAWRLPESGNNWKVAARTAGAPTITASAKATTAANPFGNKPHHFVCFALIPVCPPCSPLTCENQIHL